MRARGRRRQPEPRALQATFIATIIIILSLIGDQQVRGINASNAIESLDPHFSRSSPSKITLLHHTHSNKMKNYFLATAALSLPMASHAFLATRQSAPHIKSTLLQQQYYDQGGQQYYGGEEGQQNYDQGQYNEQQQYYDQQQQQQYYDQQQQQQQYYDQQQQSNSPYNIQNDEEPSLLITDNMSQEMARATSGVELGGIDYLALARQRAAARVESNNSQSTDADWVELAEEKKRQLGDMAEFADDEAWEKSLDDEGSLSDAASLGMGVKLEEGEGGVMMTEGGLVVDNYGEAGGDEPQLLL